MPRKSSSDVTPAPEPQPDLVAAAVEVFGDDIAPVADSAPTWGTPDTADFINLKGGQYLPARRRIIWMRGKPVAHPDWTIQTFEKEIVVGKFSGRNVQGGYARFYCEIRDAAGRVIATGTKTEYSERFMDYAEKAETGAIARALAVAGYGTESALDIDEGIENDRIADAPVNRPINITTSAVAGLRQGGRSTEITAVQMQEISRLAKQLNMGHAILEYMTGATGVAVQMPESVDLDQMSREEFNRLVMAYLNSLTFDQAGVLIQSLKHAAATNDGGVA